MKRAPNPYARAWDLRVACALISLDIVDPFLSDLGFGRDDGAAARRVARKYLVAWDTASNEAADAWLGSVRTNAGNAVVDRVAQLADALAHPGPSDLAWIELMVKGPRRDGLWFRPGDSEQIGVVQSGWSSIPGRVRSHRSDTRRAGRAR